MFHRKMCSGVEPEEGKFSFSIGFFEEIIIVASVDPPQLKIACTFSFSNFQYITESCSYGFQCLYGNVGGTVELLRNFWRY